MKALFITLTALAALLIAAVWVLTRDSRQAPRDFPEASSDLITPLGITMLAGHRAGGGMAPENTLRALRTSAESGAYRLDALEFDVHLTADGVLVLLHDGTLDRTSDGAEVFGESHVEVGSKTYAQLRRLNMGARFVAEDGSRPYAGLTGEQVPEDLRILCLDDALAYLEKRGPFYYVIEIKDSGERGFQAADTLYAALRAHGCLQRAVVGTFHNGVTAYMDRACPDMRRSAGVREVVRFYFRALLNLPLDGKSLPYEALQIPATDFFVNLGTSRIVNYAHARNIAVQYWTINEAAQMEKLQRIGADAVMTDYPALGAQVLRQPERH